MRLVTGDVKLIDSESKKVETDAGSYRYDWLISTMGCRIAPEEIDGMQQAMEDGVRTILRWSGLPVIDVEDKVIGILTRDPVCIGAEDTLHQALELMNRNRVKRLVITDDEDRVLGVISRADLIKLFTTR